MPRTLLFAATLAAAAASFPAAAIHIRPDRDDEEYRELATRYPAAVSLEAAEATGVLIAPRWILTAASRASLLAGKAPEARVRIAGALRELRAVFVHPDWQPGGSSDIALVFLGEPVPGVPPSPIYRESKESGETVRIVGFGETGPMGERKIPAKRDSRVRAAVNTVDRVDALTLGLRLKPPEEASDLQGALGTGDRGAPAFFEIGDRILVAGIASRTEDTNADGFAGNSGDWEIFTRVSAFAAWIDDVMFKAAVAEAARETAKPVR